MRKTLNKAKDLASRAGKWLGLTKADTPPRHTTAVQGDRMDDMTWADLLNQSPRLRELASDFQWHFAHAGDLLRDVFLSAYKTHPQVRNREDMDPSRLVNHEIISMMLDSPGFVDLRQVTAGDDYAAAMAVLHQADELRRMLEGAKDAQHAADAAATAHSAAADAAAAVATAHQQATTQADEHGNVPDDAAHAVDAAIAAAASADASAQQASNTATRELAAAARGLRAAARHSAEQANQAVQQEATLMRAWGVSAGQLQRMDFQQRARLADRLRSSSLSAYVNLIGRFKTMAAGERARKIPRAPGELVGITLGDDLSRLVPGELANLALPALRPSFLARFAEKRLMVYNSRGQQRAGQGAIIACVDCSGSMTAQHHGVTREAWSKAFALALLDQARAAHRDFIGILFSSASQVQTFQFPHGQADLDEVLAFAESFHGGGTDFEAPLSTAVEHLREQDDADDRQRGDIVLITDGLAEVTEHWKRDWFDTKQLLGFRAFGVAIDDDRAVRHGAVLHTLCDNVRSIDDLTDTSAVADLFRTI